MNLLRNLVMITVYMAVGAVLGDLAGHLALMPIVMVKSVSHQTEHLTEIVGAVIGAITGLTRYAGSGPARQTWGVHGWAHWADARQVKASLGGPAGLIVGRENREGGQLLRYAGPAHLLTIAPTRSGKGVGAIIPNLLTAERSVLCIDPKGENARVTLRARRRVGPVHVLDPFGICDVPTAAFNPLDALKPDSLDLAEDAALLADALVYDPPGQAGDAHWNEEAKALIAGLILHIVCHEEPGARNLPTLRRLLIGALARSPALPTQPVLLLLDEFAALGRLEPIERAFGLMAGYGLQLWPILQDLHQLRAVYGQSAGTFLSNAGLLQVFNVADVETAEWVSRSIGSATFTYQTTGSSISRGPGPLMFPQKTTSTSQAAHLAKRELVTPDEVMRLGAALEILLRQGHAPVLARKVRYYTDREFERFL